MNERGERGPHGDHGQTGDTGEQGEAGAVGKTGAVGEAGATGESGATGATGRTGKPGRGMPGVIALCFLVLAIVIAIVLGGMSYYIVQLRHIARENQRIGRENRALILENKKRVAEALTAKAVQCAQRDDLEAEVEATSKILNPKTVEEKEDAVLIFRAIPRRLVVSGQRRSLTTLQNLDILTCSASKK